MRSVLFLVYHIFCFLELDEAVFQCHVNLALYLIAADENEIHTVSCSVVKFRILIVNSREKYAYLTSSLEDARGCENPIRKSKIRKKYKLKESETERKRKK
jgi:hypothetical protein